MHSLFKGLLCVLPAITVASAARSWSFSDATLAVGPKGKDARASFAFNSNLAVHNILELGPADTLRLTFTATEDDKASRPHQSFILVQDTSANLDVIVPIPVKPSGKAKIDIDHRDLPPQLLYVDSLQLSLVIASFGESNPLKFTFATVKPITNEASPSKPDSPERWHPKPEITHTFRAPQKLPNKGLSLLFTAAVLAGLPVFFLLILCQGGLTFGQLMFASADLDAWNTAMTNAPMAHAMFFASLVLFEIRFFRYWVDGTLGQILVEAGAIGIVAFLSGRSALGEVMRRRAGKP